MRRTRVVTRAQCGAHLLQGMLKRVVGGGKILEMGQTRTQGVLGIVELRESCF